MKTALIFGINGQDGYYLKLLLEEKGYQVVGISRSEGNWHVGDIKDFGLVNGLIQQYQPTEVYHLAANSTTRHDVLFENHETISTGTLNILEAVYRNSQDTRVFISGSAMQFENKGNRIHEETPFEASSPYSIARIQSVYAARYYRSRGLKVYCGYFFNHESPLRTPRHVSRMIVDAVKRIADGSKEKIELGDILVQKEWNFAGDFARAIYTLVNQEEVFEAVIGSGRAYSIEDWLKVCFGKVDIKWQDHVLLKEGFVPEYNLLVSDPSKLFSLGYKPAYSFEQLAALMMES